MIAIFGFSSLVGLLVWLAVSRPKPGTDYSTAPPKKNENDAA